MASDTAEAAGQRTPDRTSCNAASTTWHCCTGRPASQRSTKSSANQSSCCCCVQLLQLAP
eukprot:4346137-Lingulodinium_polyedra.AAC.1